VTGKILVRNTTISPILSPIEIHLLIYSHKRRLAGEICCSSKGGRMVPISNKELATVFPFKIGSKH
jgi:hypothetical protein